MTAELIKGVLIGAALMATVAIGGVVILATAIWKDIR